MRIRLVAQVAQKNLQRNFFLRVNLFIATGDASPLGKIMWCRPKLNYGDDDNKNDDDEDGNKFCIN